MTGGLFAVLDDIALLLDDAAVMSKVAAKKTAGLLGDDLAVNAEKATGFHTSRELPVLWAITKGSFINKLIILPTAFLLSAYLPWLILPALLLGGVYLSYEGVEKIYHVLFHRHATKESPAAVRAATGKGLVKMEQAKIRSAIRTDFILSIEIIIITLGTVIDKSIALQIVVVSLIALLATVGVYGLVALLVRMDDAGLFLVAASEKMAGLTSKLCRGLGRALVLLLPIVIRALTVIGTLAMLLVGGGMFTHNLAMLHHLSATMPILLGDLIMGISVGTVTLTMVMLGKRLVGKAVG